MVLKLNEADAVGCTKNLDLIDLELTYREYCSKYDDEHIYLVSKDRSFVLSISEGSGDNLDADDEEDGYVDYWYVEGIDKDGTECGGGFLMLTELIRDANPTVAEIIDLAKNSDELDDQDLIRTTEYIVPNEGEEIYNKYDGKLMDCFYAAKEAYTIDFNGKSYFAKDVRTKNGTAIIAEEDLEKALLTPGGGDYISPEAKKIDEGIYGYLPHLDVLYKTEGELKQLVKEHLDLED